VSTTTGSALCVGSNDPSCLFGATDPADPLVFFCERGGCNYVEDDNDESEDES
jgi:hypothetical protein